MSDEDKEIIKVGIIIPTLGVRLHYLKECIQSIKRDPNVFLIIISPNKLHLNSQLSDLVDRFFVEESRGLASAINQGVSEFPPSIKYFNWLGDDDLLTPNSLVTSRRVLKDNPGASGVYGMCEYINSVGSRIGINSSGPWARQLIRFGPNLIPQPGALISREIFRQIGGLRTDLKLAFDVDMFIKLQKVSSLAYIPSLLGKFRWHRDSLTVKARLVSVRESSKIRREHLPRFTRVISPLWEIPLMISIYLAGLIVHIKNLRIS